MAEAVGVPVIELPTHNLPGDGGYATFVVEMATLITGGLTAA
ncbi:unannotated protein [freshwater metagenome]|uniref:Unannotated protein n=1 Tax=freshwater metagenome TaxID=449393 RepID=A0A6J6FZM2_9ZZZZ